MLFIVINMVGNMLATDSFVYGRSLIKCTSLLAFMASSGH